MFDEAELMGDLPRPRWPLHPAPRPLERLETYIRRSADTYGMGVATFCRYGLGCAAPSADVRTIRRKPCWIDWQAAPASPSAGCAT